MKNRLSLGRLNRLRPKISLESDSHCLCINFFVLNTASESKSLRRNLFQQLKNPLKSSNSIERDQKYIESD